MKTKMKMLIATLSVALLMVFSFNVFSQTTSEQGDKDKKSSCMAMMENKEDMNCMDMMKSKDMKDMCAKMMSGMKDGDMEMDGDMKMDGNMKMDINNVKSGEPKSQKL